MCGFQDFDVGDTKYIVEHWMRRDEVRQMEDACDSSDDSSRAEINWDAPEREHLCPACAVERGLDYDRYYKQNKHAPVVAKTNKRGGSDDDPTEDDDDTKPKAKLAKISACNDNMTNNCQLAVQTLKEANLQSCTLVPHAECPLFVAWSGVLVLAYSGFPSTILKAKSLMEEACGGADLRDENFGSKWPKTSLAAVFDKAPAFSMEEMTKLKELCALFGQKINQLVSNQQATIHITSLSVVEYECCSLEQVSRQVDIPMVETNTKKPVSAPPQEQKEVVDSVVREWNSLADYLPKVNNQAGSRMTSYRQPAQGATCVAFLKEALSENLLQVLIDFRIAVDLEFPGRFAWFAEKAWHCTLRTLDARKT